MPLFRAQVVIPYFTNLPKDVMTNTLHVFSTVAGDTKESVGDQFTPILKTFYQSVYSNGVANYVLINNIFVNWYALDDPAPRTPYVKTFGTMGITPAATPIPTEVACVISFQGTPLSGTPQSRRRGRIYIGGLNSAWFVASTTNAFPTFNNTVLAGVAAAANTMRTQSSAPTLSWRVFSPTTGANVLVANGWVDGSPDTQRRRSVDEISRTLFP